MSDISLINKLSHRIYPTHLGESKSDSSFSWSAVLPQEAKSALKDSEGHRQISDRNSHTLTHKLKDGASVEFNMSGNGKQHIAMAKYHKGGKLFTAIHSHEDPNKAMATAYQSVKKRMVTEEAEPILVEKMAKRIEKKTGKISDKKEKIDVEPSEEKELKESAKKNQIRKFTFGKDNIHLYHSGTGETYSITPKKIVKIHTGQDTPSGYRYSDIKSGREIKRIHKLLKNAQEGNKELKESTPPGMESWVKKNKAHFVKEYGDKKGHEVLYATAWKLHDKMNEMEELNELSKKTLASYVHKAAQNVAIHAAKDRDYDRLSDVTSDKKERLLFKNRSDYHTKKWIKRLHGIEKATDKLSESREELNELSKKTLASYVKKSNHSSFELGYDAASNEFHDDGDYKKTQKDEKKALKRQRFVSKAVDKLAEAEYPTDTKQGILAQLDYHHGRENYHRQSAEMNHRKANKHALGSENYKLYKNVAKGQEAIAAHHYKSIQDLHKKFATINESEGKVEMMYLSKGFISPKLAEKLARESKHLGTDKSTGEQHYLHPQHGRMALVPHKSGEFQFRLAEEIEQLDELSPSTLGRYIKFAAVDKASHAAHSAISHRAQIDAEMRGSKESAKTHEDNKIQSDKKSSKRLNGIIKATDKLVHKAVVKEEQLEETTHPDKVVMTSGIRKDLGGGYMAKTRNGHFYKLNANELKGTLPHIGSVLDVSKHKFLGKHKVDLNLLKEELDHDHPDMKAYYEAAKATDEAHLKSIRYRMHHDIKHPTHKNKYDELETEHQRLKDLENKASEKVHGRLFAHHAMKK